MTINPGQDHYQKSYLEIINGMLKQLEKFLLNIGVPEGLVSLVILSIGVMIFAIALDSYFSKKKNKEKQT